MRRSLFLGSRRCFSTNSILVNKRSDGVCIITLNDAPRLNALTAAMGDTFNAVIDDLCSRGCQGVGAVVLTGSGRAFSAGGDLEFLRERAADTPLRNSIVMRRFYDRFLSLRRLPVPIIAAINGPAVGAGMCVALACDMRIANRSSKMGFTFTKLGLHPGMGATHFLSPVVGPQQASRLLFTGELITAERALSIGLISDISDGDCVDDAIALAQSMASSSSVAVRTCVRSLRMKQDEGLDRALTREADSQSQCYVTDDLRNGVEAIARKEKPVFAAPVGFQDPLL